MNNQDPKLFGSVFKSKSELVLDLCEVVAMVPRARAAPFLDILLKNGEMISVDISYKDELVGAWVQLASNNINTTGATSCQ